MGLDELKLSDRDRKLYGTLYMATHDIGIARQCAAFLKKKGWHTYPFLRRGSTQIQQIAMTTTMVVAYCRPFKPGHGNGAALPQKLVQYDQDEKALHYRLLNLRDKVHAHTDTESYSIRPLDNEYIKSIDGVPYPHFSESEVDLFLKMTGELQRRISARAEEIHASARTKRHSQLATQDIRAALQKL